VSWLRTSLFWKLMLAFSLVVLVAVGSVAFIASQTTSSEFHRLRQGEGSSGSSDLGQRLAGFYEANGSWEGVSELFDTRSGQGRGGGSSGGGRGGPPVRLADADGRVILNTVDGQVGYTLSENEQAQGDPIIVDDDRVGTLLQGGLGSASLSQADQEFLDRVQRALILGALIAIGVATVLGFFLFRGIIAPLRRLTQATEKVASGDLSVRVPLPAENGDEISQLGSAFNHMTADLARADQLRRDMTADIAHELRTPITVIQGNLEAILDGIYPSDREHLEPVLRKTQLLRRLVEDLRTLALADAGELTLQRTLTDLGGLIQDTVQGFGATARLAQVALAVQVPEHLARVRADGARIEQVLGILLDNALRHTPAGGRIIIAGQIQDQKCRISVRDTGEGIPPDALPHVFERFYRSPSERARASGTGLGLAIARAIIEAHGGRIWAESPPGQGTVITFALPLIPGKASA
jgi:two-component system OmpR family sensor kinase/two-component system sensor histidine kinase BaeS